MSTFQDAFRGMFPQTVTIAADAGMTNEFGAPVLSAPQTYSCLIDWNQKQVINRNGEYEVSSGTVILNTALPFSFKPSSKITMPDGTSPRIINVHTYSSPDGPEVTEIYV